MHRCGALDVASAKNARVLEVDYLRRFWRFLARNSEIIQPGIFAFGGFELWARAVEKERGRLFTKIPEIPVNEIVK